MHRENSLQNTVFLAKIGIAQIQLNILLHKFLMPTVYSCYFLKSCIASKSRTFIHREQSV